MCVPSNGFPCSFFWRARKSSQHHKTFQINSSLACQNAFPLPSTPAGDYRDLLWNGLIVQGIKDFYGSISGCALNCEFQIQTAHDPRPWAASAAEALCCFARLKLADTFEFAAPLLNLSVIALRKTMAQASDSRPTCVRAMKSPSSNFFFFFCGRISATATRAHFDEIYSLHRMGC